MVVDVVDVPGVLALTRGAWAFRALVPTTGA
jgi:hypothetical protein